jgi:hypothetical protein
MTQSSIPFPTFVPPPNAQVTTVPYGPTVMTLPAETYDAPVQRQQQMVQVPSYVPQVAPAAPAGGQTWWAAQPKSTQYAILGGGALALLLGISLLTRTDAA